MWPPVLTPAARRMLIPHTSTPPPDLGIVQGARGQSLRASLLTGTCSGLENEALREPIAIRVGWRLVGRAHLGFPSPSPSALALSLT